MGVDLIRNFVIEHFKDEATMRQVHADYWSPLEKKAGGTFEGLEALFKNFLETHGFRIKHRWYLYSAFIVWWRGGKKVGSSTESAAIAKLGTLLQDKLRAKVRLPQIGSPRSQDPHLDTALTSLQEISCNINIFDMFQFGVSLFLKCLMSLVHSK